MSDKYKVIEEDFSKPDADAEKLATEQRKISTKVWNRAIKNHLMTGLDTDYAWPIYDGVADTESYLAMKPRIMFVLKEPYDDSKIDEQGRKVPYGGGWDFPELLKKQSEAQHWPIRTWQRVIYALYGYRNGKHYHEMDYIRNAPEMGRLTYTIPM